MINTQYLAVNISVTLRSHIVFGAENHNVAVGSLWVDDVLGSTNIVCSIIKPSHVVTIYLVILEDDRISILT